MLSKRPQDHSNNSSSSSSEIAVSRSSVDGSNLQSARRTKCTPMLTTTNGLLDDSVKVGRHVHWQTTDSTAADSRRRGSADDKQRSAGGVEGRGHRVRGLTDDDDIGGGGPGGEGVRPSSGRGRLISVKPFSAEDETDEKDADAATTDEEEEEQKKEAEDYDDDAKRKTETMPDMKVALEVTPNSKEEDSHVATLPVIDLESDTCIESGVEDRRCVEDIRASGVRPDPVRPKSFLADNNGSTIVTTPATVIDEATVVEPFDGDATRIDRKKKVSSDASDATSIAAAAAAAPAADAVADAEGVVDGASAVLSGSSSSSQSLDRTASLLHDFSSDLSLLPDPVSTEADSTPFARVQPGDEQFLEERGECDGEEAPPPVYILPGSNLRYTDDMILTSRPSKVNLLYSPAPPRTRILFQIIRDKVGFYRKYYAHLELNGDKIFYLAGRKRVKSRSSSYVISIDRERLLRASDAYVGKLRSNYMGTKFTLYYTAAEVAPSNPEDQRTGARSKNRHKKELASIIYAPNPLGFYGPRRMTVILPGIAENVDQPPLTPQNATQDDSLIGRYKARQLRDLIVLHNKPPIWERAKNSYVLNFHGRVTQPSVKNFQLVPPEDHNDIVMQFGRTGENTFTMDYRRPLSAVQAFGIVLSCFDCKLACE